MTIQTTFRSVAKPKVKLLTAALAGGQLPMEQATMFIFAGSAVGTVSSLLDHEYLIDGQEVAIVNAHPSNSLTITIGAFSKVIPAGYSCVLAFDEANTSFYEHRKHADLKPIEDDAAANQAAITQEVADRQADTALNYRLDGSRALTGNMDVNSNFLFNVPEATSSDHVVQKGQLDTIVAALESQISANATSLQWRSKVQYISKFTSGTIPANGDALIDQNFGSGNNRLFEDDDAPSQVLAADIAVGSEVVFLKDGVEPKKMIVREVLGAKYWYDETEADANLKLERQVAAGDTFIVENDLLDVSDAREKQAIYHIEDGSPKTALKIADLDWETATGIAIAAGYSKGSGGETVVVGDSVQQALQKLDGNIDANDAAQTAALSAAISQEVIDRDAAIAAAIAQEVIDRDAAISTSQTAQDNKLASVAVNEGASLVGVHDADALYAASTVEGALREARQHINTAEADIVALETDVAGHTTEIGQHTLDISDLYSLDTQHKADLASTDAGKGASLIGIHDANLDFTATTVEGALAELDQKVDSLNLVNLKRGLFEVTTTGATSLNLATNFVDQLSGGVVQDLSDATYVNATVNRDGAILIGGVGFTISGSTITFTAAGGGELVEGEVIEIKIIEVS